jgi:hypothetical protein
MSERKYCVRCSHRAGEKDKFCTQCGAPLENRCTNDGGPLGDPCEKICDRNAAFCPACGCYTSFYKAGLVHTVYPAENKDLIQNELDEYRYFSHPFFTNE